MTAVARSKEKEGRATFAVDVLRPKCARSRPLGALISHFWAQNIVGVAR